MGKLAPKGPIPKEIKTTYRELATALVRLHDLRAGHWQVGFRFGIQGMTAQVNDDLWAAAAVVPIVGMSLVRVEKPTPHSVDAAQVNRAVVAPTQAEIGKLKL